MTTDSRKVEHTPGPWQRGTIRGLDCNTICDARSVVVAQSQRPIDGYLIAAAPELLAALKEYVRDFGDNEDSDSQIMAAKARAAIAKAEGRA